MLKKYELVRIESEKQLAFQHMQLTLAAYIDAKSRTKIAYCVMQSAWEERRDARDKLGIEESIRGAEAMRDESVYSLKVNFEQAKWRHKMALSEYALARAKKDWLKAELDLAQAEYKRLKDELERARSKDDEGASGVGF